MPPIAAATVPLCLLAVDRSEAPNLASSFRTGMVVSTGTHESRRCQTPKPFRILTYKAATLDRSQIGGILAQTRKGSEGRFYYPLWTDESKVEDGGTDTFVPCATATRRFFVGFKAIVTVWDTNKRASKIHVSVIQSISPTGVTLVDPCPFEIASTDDATVSPAIEVDVDFDVSMSALTDRVLVPSLVLKERVGATALPPLVSPGTNPSGETIYNTYPVFNVPIQWEQPSVGQSRANLSTEVGLDMVPTIFGDRATSKATFPFQCGTRVEAFRLLKFFDSRGGKAFPFWGYTGTSDFNVISKTSGTVWVVKADLSAADLLKQKFMAFIGLDFTVEFRRITAAVAAGANVTVTLDAAVSFTTANLDRVSYGMLCRFDSDEIKENWLTDETMTTTLSVVEIPSNTCGTGEAGDVCAGETDIPCVPDEGTDTDPQDPWNPNDNPCEGQLDPSPLTIPMYCYPCEALNTEREIIRGADLSLPSNISIKISDGFERDPGHPSGITLSPEFFKALLNDNDWHIIPYVGVTASTGSRHWHHLRLTNESTPTWGMNTGGETVVKYMYQKLIPYVAFEGTPSAANRTLDIRFLIEWTTSTTSGARGALINWHVFTDEAYPSFTDGNNYTPAGAPGLVTFSRNDPCCWGRLVYPAVSTGAKYFHPQLALSGNIATTFQAPCGTAKVPLGQEHRAVCYKQGNGAPWCSPTLPGVRSRNIVFGHSITTLLMRACTLGGDVPFSEFFEWLTLENGKKEGKTLLRPLMPGWDETEGELLVNAGLNVEVLVCPPSQTANRVDVCLGHLSEPFEGVGGTHRCFKNKDTNSGGVCEKIGPYSTVSVYEQCIKEESRYDSDCDPISGRCSVAQVFSTSFSALLKDYSYKANGSPTARFMEFEIRAVDTRYVPFNYSYVSGVSLNLVQDRGSWAFGPNIVVASLTGLGPPAILRYNHGGAYDDVSTEALAHNGASGTIPIGLAVRATLVSSNWSGIAGVVLPGLTTIQIRLYVNNVYTILAQKTGVNLHGDIPMKLTAVGAKFTFEVGGEVITAYECTQTSGYPCLITDGAVAGATFSGWKVSDLHQDFLTASSFIRVDDFSVSAPIAACKGYGKCENTVNPGCPDSGTCPCTIITYHKDAIYGGGAPADLTSVPGGPNPDALYCNAEPLSPPTPNCGDCPPPYVGITIRHPGKCIDSAVTTVGPYEDGYDCWVSVRGVPP